MNTEITVHPKLQHYALGTANIDAMIDWYRKVLGMTINYRSVMPAGAPFSAAAFVSNDEVHHRLVFFEIPGLGVNPDKPRHNRLQHVAYEHETLDDLLGTYVRLKGLGILPVMAVDEGVGTAFYYADPDRNIAALRQQTGGSTLEDAFLALTGRSIREAGAEPIDRMRAMRQARGSRR